MHNPIPRVAFVAILTLLSAPAICDARSSVEELIELAEKGDSKSQLELAARYRDGDGVKRDHGQALQWYRACADQGDAAGLENVGQMYLRGMGVDVNFDIAAAYFKASAAKGDAQAQFNLGNCYFSGQGVEQDYKQAIANWQRAAEQDHLDAKWRLAILHASGEGLPQDREKAEELCKELVESDHVNGALLLGELLAQKGNSEEAVKWWSFASERGGNNADDLLALQEWRFREPVPGEMAFVELDHLFQGWNNCGATSIAMFARHLGAETTPYAVKRLCPRGPIGTGTDWSDLVAACDNLDQQWELVTFDYDDEGFDEGAQFIRQRIDNGEPVVIDFTYLRGRGDRKSRVGHTLLVVGYNVNNKQFVLRNPNQPSPGLQLISEDKLKSQWYSNSYSRVAKGRDARPLIVVKQQP